jgi:excisionase family DNA binding protein
METRLLYDRKEAADVLTLTEAAALLRVHPVTLRKRAVAWGVPHKRLGAEWRFSRSVLEAWIQGRAA